MHTSKEVPHTPDPSSLWQLLLTLCPKALAVPVLQRLYLSPQIQRR